MADIPVQMMKVTMDGEVVAELPIIIHDAAKTWEAFTASYSEIASHLMGEFFQCMRIACREDLQHQFGQYIGLNMDISTGIRPQLIVPNNFPGGGL